MSSNIGEKIRNVREALRGRRSVDGQTPSPEPPKASLIRTGQRSQPVRVDALRTAFLFSLHRAALRNLVHP